MQDYHLLSTVSCEDHSEGTFEEVKFFHVAAFYGQCLLARIQATVQVVARFFVSGSTHRATIITRTIIIITALLTERMPLIRLVMVTSQVYAPQDLNGHQGKKTTSLTEPLFVSISTMGQTDAKMPPLYLCQSTQDVLGHVGNNEKNHYCLFGWGSFYLFI